jgi:hypothetical protein
VTIAAVAFVLLVIGTAAALLWPHLRARWTRRSGTRTERILFPFTGAELSTSALDAALRLAQAENATLVPAFLAQVPLTLPLASPLPKACQDALPILEAIEQRAARAGVPVDTRIERGRTSRHALAELIDHERFDRIVAPAATPASDGFSPDDVAWLLDHARGDIVVFRSGNSNGNGAAAARTLLD